MYSRIFSYLHFPLRSQLHLRALSTYTPWQEFLRVTRHEQTVPPTHRCILDPPFGGSYGDTMVTFDVIHGIRAGETHWAQVLAVKVVNASPQLSNCS